MNILGMGVAELILVLLIALIVAGPQRLARWAYVLGRYMGQARAMWGSMMESVQKEFDDAGLDIKLPKDFTNRGQMRRFADEALKPLRDPMKQAMDEYKQEAQQLETTIRKEAQIDMTNLDKPAGNGASSTSQDRETATGEATATSTPESTEAPAKATEGSNKPGDFGTWSGMTVPRGENKE